jgi:thiamine transport system permease protein
VDILAGLQGILLAHVFFNMPMATRLFLQALENIPGEQRQIAAQLGMRGWSFFRFVEWPWLRRQIPPVAALIFMLCFASFATVLSLGGGPQATTIELAIYQALSYDYDPGRAALLAMCRWLLPGAGAVSQRLSKAIPAGRSNNRLARSAGQPAQPPYRFYPDRAGAPASAAAAAGGYR